MATWIFQGNPERFDIEGYLNAKFATVAWTVRQHRDEVSIGDTVYIWRSQGKEKDLSGVVAECRVTSAVSETAPDAASAHYWREVGEAKTEPRVSLIVLRTASGKRILQRDWLTTDPILRNMLIFRQAQGTNFKLSSPESQRLSELWTRTGIDWTWRDSVAGLWAYVQTREKEISKLPGSPVSDTALEIGRAVTGVYNKVMNFRSIDPTDARSGLTGAGAIDRKAWSTFFDFSENEINKQQLKIELERLGLGNLTGVESKRDPQNIIIPIITGELSELMSKYAAALSSGAYPSLPDLKETLFQAFQRNPLVVAVAKARANYACEIPDCSAPSFHTVQKQAYCEVHHIVPLSEGGEDIIENAICLCPSHHREAHYGSNRSMLKSIMQNFRSTITLPISDTSPS